MVNVDIQLGHKNAAWFTANASRVLLDGQIVYLNDQSGQYKIGDGTTQLSALSFLGNSGNAVDSVNGYTGAVVLTKSDLSLGNVDNTSDANKPVSTAQSTAIGLKEDSSNKSTSTSDFASSTKFPVWAAIVSFFDATKIKSILGITTLSGSNTGDETAARIGAITNGSTDYPTPLDADKIGVWDVANSLFKALTLANLKATLKTYFDTLYSSGSLYIPNVWISPNFTTKSTGSGWNGTAWFVPFFVAKQTTITELGIEVTTGVAASTIRIGLFSADSSGNVGTLIDQTGTMSSVSTGVKSTIISQSIASGLYYLGFQSSAAGVAVRQGNVVSNINEIGGTGAAILRSTLAYGAFSSNPTVTFTTQTNAPYLLFKTS